MLAGYLCPLDTYARWIPMPAGYLCSLDIYSEQDAVLRGHATRTHYSFQLLITIINAQCPSHHSLITLWEN